MEELRELAVKLQRVKDALIKSQKLISVAKRAGEDVSNVELSFNEKRKKYQRWEQVLKEEGYEI